MIMTYVKLQSIKHEDLVNSNASITSFSTDDDESIYTMIKDALSRNSKDSDIMYFEPSKTWDCFISLTTTERTEDTIRAFNERNIETIAENSELVPISR